MLRGVGNGGCSRWSQSVNLGRFAHEDICEGKGGGRKDTQAWPSEKSHHKERFARGTDHPTERLAIASKAKNAGVRISDWFRQSAKVAVIRSRLSKEETGHLRTLSGMANNLELLPLKRDRFRY